MVGCLSYMMYLCAFLQQELHTISIRHHTGTVQRLQRAMHPVHICSLSKEHIFIQNVIYTKQLSKALVTQLTLRIRSSTLSCGKERMAAMVRMSLSDNEYLL